MATPASDVVTRHPPGRGPGLETAALPSAPFQTEHLSGRVFFSGLPDVTPDLIPVIDLVAREVGNSLDQLHVAARLKQLAVQEDRIALARDLHDGVLQSLTGVRLALQAMAEEGGGSSSLQDRLLAMERAIAIEQRELRLFIQGIKPAAGAETGAVARSLGEISRRIALEWKAPVFIRVEPPELSLEAGAERALRLMVHEAVVNALRHAHPSRVSVSVRAEGSDVHVVVADDGRGFAFKGRWDHEALDRANAGPVTLRERVTALGGRLAVESTASGSRIELTFPTTV
jgi:signal transduction histidine kinase